MDIVIYALAKIFKEKDYAQDFMAGKILMNPLKKFIKKDKVKIPLRDDPEENCVALYQPGHCILKIAGHTISDMAGPIRVSLNYLLNCKACSFISVDSREFDSIRPDKLSEFAESLKIDNRCFGFGPYCVAIVHVNEFIDRVSKALLRENMASKMGLVQYYDEATFHGAFGEEEYGFMKRKCYGHQRELRILVQGEDENPLILDVGDLSNISILTTPEDFNKTLQVKLPE